MSIANSIPNTYSLSIYLCYAPEDLKEVRKLHVRLISNGFSPWAIDIDGLGRNPKLAQEKINECDAIVVCLSQTAVSGPGRLLGEIDAALEIERSRHRDEVFLIPVRLGIVENSKIPFELRNRPIVNLQEDSGFAPLLALLKECRAQDGIQHDVVNDSSTGAEIDLGQVAGNQPGSPAPEGKAAQSGSGTDWDAGAKPQQATPPSKATKIALFIFGVIAIVAAITLQVELGGKVEWFLIVLVAALGSAGIGASLPGIIQYKGKDGWSGEGASVLLLLVLLTGTGAAYLRSKDKVTAEPDHLDFKNQQRNTTSAAQEITLKNDGNEPVNIPPIPSPFHIANTAASSQTKRCGDAVEKKDSCRIAIDFEPSEEGQFLQTFTITGDKVSPAIIKLTGTGIPKPKKESTITPNNIDLTGQDILAREPTPSLLTVTPTSVTFADQPVHTRATQKITIANTGRLSVAFKDIYIDHREAFVDDFNCPDILRAGETCYISIDFRPVEAASQSDTLTLISNAQNSRVEVPLTGTGIPNPNAKECTVQNKVADNQKWLEAKHSCLFLPSSKYGQTFTDIARGSEFNAQLIGATVTDPNDLRNGIRTVEVQVQVVNKVAPNKDEKNDKQGETSHFEIVSWDAASDEPWKEREVTKGQTGLAEPFNATLKDVPLRKNVTLSIYVCARKEVDGYFDPKDYFQRQPLLLGTIYIDDTYTQKEPPAPSRSYYTKVCPYSRY